MLYWPAVVLAFAALLLSGAMAGLFYAFSISVMRGLDAVAGTAAVAAMQSINRRILNPIFLTMFLLTPVVALLSGILFLVIDEQLSGMLLLAASAIYLAGAFAPTVAINVPMNEALDKGTPQDEAAAAAIWAGYSPRWTRWNHLRALACFASLGLTGAGLLAMS